MAGVIGKVDALARLRRTARPEAAHARQGAGQRHQAKAGHAGQRARGQADGLRRVGGGRGIGLRRGAHGGVSGAVQTEVLTGRRHGASPGRRCRAEGAGRLAGGGGRGHALVSPSPDVPSSRSSCSMAFEAYHRRERGVSSLSIQHDLVVSPGQLCSKLLHKFGFRPRLGKCTHVLEIARRKPLHLREGHAQIP